MWTENPIFREDLDRLTSYDYIPWDDLRDSTVFITGATGLIGYTAVCALLRYDQLHDAGIKVVALVRDVGRAEAKFSRQIADGCDITFIRGSVEYLPEIVGKIDYIIHGACPTSSQYFVDHAVETIDTIVNGTKTSWILHVRRMSQALCSSPAWRFSEPPPSADRSQKATWVISTCPPRAAATPRESASRRTCAAPTQASIAYL